MPSFKDRFRSSRKSKKNKENSSNVNDDSTTASGLCTSISPVNALATTDDHASSAVLSNHQTYYSVEYCK